MSTNQPELHVVLGSGPAGSTLAAELQRRGHTVRLVDRRAASEPMPGIELVAADLSDKAAAVEATAGADVIYHCVNVAYHLQVELMPLLGSAILHAAVINQARLVVMDTLYPYGPGDGSPMTEQTPWAAITRKGRLRAMLDQMYLDAHTSGKASVVAGRAADFYGPGVTNSTLAGAVFPAALTGQPVLTLGDIDLPHSYTYIRDVAAGLATLGEHPDTDGRIWHLPTAPVHTTRQILDLLAEQADRPLTTHNLPTAQAYGPFDEKFMAEYDEMFYQHTTVQNMSSTAFEERFDASPTSLEEGIGATVGWYRERLGQW